MADTLIKTGKTVEAALNAALEELGVGESDVDYDVLEQPSKGLFGILGSKPARVRVTLKEKPKNNNDIEKTVVPEEKISDDKNNDAQKSFAAEKIVQAEETASESHDDVATDDKTDGNKETSPQQKAAMDKAEKFLGDVFAAMNVDAKLERREKGSVCEFGLVGEKIGILIGKHGQTLDALQYLANLAVNRGLDDDERVRIVLDAEDYRRRRDDTLKELALRLADRAWRIREDIKLEPMNRHERKVIHTTLQNSHRVSTCSSGEEPYRCVVISPKRTKRGRNFRRDDKNNK